MWRDDTATDLLEYTVTAAVLTAILVMIKTLNIHGSDLLANIGIRLEKIR
ncbi:MAG TPA: hypothetical protein VKT29_05930 [Terriglobales bacterium]|nr:hypothetical protein [Terriglobales bacterium]